MKVIKSTIPDTSLTNQYLPVNYCDVFTCEVSSDKSISPDDILISFWTDMPGWVEILFSIRNFLVKLVGLKGSKERDVEAFENCIRNGGEHGFISVPCKNENETVMVLTDEHLNAYLSAHIDYKNDKKIISVITLVKFNKKLGNVYFFFIKPFHKVIVSEMLKRMLRRKGF